LEKEVIPTTLFTQPSESTCPACPTCPDLAPAGLLGDLGMLSGRVRGRGVEKVLVEKRPFESRNALEKNCR
jgi:hypothetical protein